MKKQPKADGRVVYRAAPDPAETPNRKKAKPTRRAWRTAPAAKKKPTAETPPAAQTAAQTDGGEPPKPEEEPLPPPPRDTALYKYLRARPRLSMTLCAVGVALCAALPAAFLHLTDLALWGRSTTLADPYTPPTPSGDDYYILRQLSARSAATATQSVTGTRPSAKADGTSQSPSVYAGGGSSYNPDNMFSGDAYVDTFANVLDELDAQGVLPDRWAQAVKTEIETNANGSFDCAYVLAYPYYSVDSLGFITLKYWGSPRALGVNSSVDDVYALASMTLDSRTGRPVEVWLSVDDHLFHTAADLLADPAEQNLQGYITYMGLDTLGDWAAPDHTPYACALYSHNGQALVSASAGSYLKSVYQGETDTYSELDRRYFLLTLTTVAESDLPYTAVTGGEADASSGAAESPALVEQEAVG